jgi:hypothetical protein
MADETLVDKDKFDALLLKIANTKPTSLGVIKSINASADMGGKPKRGRPKLKDKPKNKD